MALAYAVLVLGGWVSLTIAGMMLKIVPFLVWYRAYSPRVGREPVPTLAQLSWPRVEGVAYVLLTGGVIGLAGAVARASAGLDPCGGRGAVARRARVRASHSPACSGISSPCGGGPGTSVNPIVGSPQDSRA